MLDGKSAMLDNGDIAVAEKLMDLVAADASPQLQAAIGQVRADLRGGKLTSLFVPKSAAPPAYTVSLATPGSR